MNKEDHRALAYVTFALLVANAVIWISAFPDLFLN